MATSIVKEVLKSQLPFRARVRRFAKDAWKKYVSASGNLTRLNAEPARRKFSPLTRAGRRRFHRTQTQEFQVALERAGESLLVARQSTASEMV